MDGQLIKGAVCVGFFGVLLCSMGMQGALGLTASLSLEVSGSNVVEYDVHTGTPADWTADLIVTADGNMGLVLSHQEHSEHGVSGTLFSVTTVVDTTNDWSQTSTYAGDLSPKSGSATTAVTTAGVTGSPSGRYAFVTVLINPVAAVAAYYADQRVHHINIVNASVQDPSFSLGTISGTTGLTVKLVSSSQDVFTYHGELSEGNVQVDGDYDFRFALYDEASGGAQQGATVVKEDVGVSQGRFTVKLDFGGGVFDGNERWLEIDVRDGVLTDPGAFVTLTPRQELTATPYAIFAQDSNKHSGNVTVEGGHIGLGTAVDTGFGITNESAGSPLFGARFYGSQYGVEGRDSSTGVTTYGRLGSGGYGGYFYNKRPSGETYGSRSWGETTGNSSTYGGYNFGNTDTATSAPVYGARNQGQANNNSYTGNSYGSYNYARADGASGNIYGAYNITDAYRSDNSKTVYGTYSWGYGIGSSSGTHYGVYGKATAGTGTKYGLSGEAGTDSTSGLSFGVQGLAYGTSTKFGGNFTGGTSTTTGTAYGVRGFAYSSTGNKYGGYFFGNSAGSGNSYGVYGWGGTYDFYAVGPGINYGAASSIRWKDDVRVIEDPLGKVSQLRGVRFVWDAEHGGREDVGMIAEEVGAVLPEIVQYEENGVDAMGMDYSKLTPLLVEAVKALKGQVDTQTATHREALSVKDVEIRELKERLGRLEAAVSRMSQKGI